MEHIHWIFGDKFTDRLGSAALLAQRLTPTGSLAPAKQGLPARSGAPRQPVQPKERNASCVPQDTRGIIPLLPTISFAQQFDGAGLMRTAGVPLTSICRSISMARGHEGS